MNEGTITLKYLYTLLPHYFNPQPHLWFSSGTNAQFIIFHRRPNICFNNLKYQWMPHNLISDEPTQSLITQQVHLIANILVSHYFTIHYGSKSIYNLFIYLTDVLHLTQEYFTNTTGASILLGGNQSLPVGNSRPSALCWRLSSNVQLLQKVRV